MNVATEWLRRRSRWALTAGALGAAALAVTTTATLGGFTASITNNADTASTGSLVLQEVVGGTNGATCLSTGTGSTGSTVVNSTNANTSCPGNKFGALTNAAPGASNATSVVVTNVGTITASTLTMTAGACTQGNATGTTYHGSDSAFCSKVDITIEDDTLGTTTATGARCVYPALATICPALSNTYNLSTYATAYTAATSILPASTTVAAGAARTYSFNVGIDASAATNADQGLSVSQPITFILGQ
jgi:hypothetical protein